MACGSDSDQKVYFCFASNDGPASVASFDVVVPRRCGLNIESWAEELQDGRAAAMTSKLGLAMKLHWIDGDGSQERRKELFLGGGEDKSDPLQSEREAMGVTWQKVGVVFAHSVSRILSSFAPISFLFVRASSISGAQFVEGCKLGPYCSVFTPVCANMLKRCRIRAQ